MIHNRDIWHILQHTAPLFDDLRGKSVLLLGGTGFIGCWLLEALTTINDQYGLDMRITVNARENKTFNLRAPHLARRRDLHFRRDDVRQLWRGNIDDHDYIVYLALGGATPLELFDCTIDGTRAALKLAAQSGARLLVMSTGAVYGDAPYMVDERELAMVRIGNAKFAYDDMRRAAETLCTLYAGEQTNVVVARGFAFVGPYLQMGAYAIGQFIEAGLAGGPVVVNSPQTLRSYLYGADMAIWLLHLLVRGRAGEAYNVGSSTSYSLGDVGAIVADVLRCSLTLGNEPAQQRAIYIPSTVKAQRELGLERHIKLRDAIQRTVEWTRTGGYTLDVPQAVA